MAPPPRYTVKGYWPGRWPCEDGGPRRLQSVPDPKALAEPASLRLVATSRRRLMTTMTVLGDPGEIFLLTHQALRSRIGLPTTAQVERIDPLTLRPLARSPRLDGGPIWPGGMAVHRNGDLYIVYGRYIHRLGRADLAVRAVARLPVDQPYNSFVILDSGLIVTKNLSARSTAQLCVIDPDDLTMPCPPLDCGEPSVARLSAVGNTIYVVGVRTITRYHWDGTALRRDDSWACPYIGNSQRSHGWDAVIGDRHLWLMDNGQHRYRTSMVGRGVAQAPNRLIRVALADAEDWQGIDVSGLPGGSITNPPLWDEARQIVIAYDSANRVICGFRFEEEKRALVPLWRQDGLGSASHMLHFPESGLICTNDYQRREAIVLLDIASGATVARVETGGFMQGVVFPSPGWNQDFYWCSMDQVTRIAFT